jgi:hypothetical protein
MRKFLTALTAAALTLTLAGCAGDQMGDKPIDEGRDVHDADSVTIYRNVDGYPNLGVVCIRRVAFVTTSRRTNIDGTPTYYEVLRVPEFDDTCPTPE